MRRLAAALLSALMLMSTSGAGIEYTKEIKETFNEELKTAWTEQSFGRGDKLVCRDYETGDFFTAKFIPKELRANTVEEVGAVITAVQYEGEDTVYQMIHASNGLCFEELAIGEEAPSKKELSAWAENTWNAFLPQHEIYDTLESSSPTDNLYVLQENGFFRIDEDFEYLGEYAADSFDKACGYFRITDRRPGEVELGDYDRETVDNAENPDDFRYYTAELFGLSGRRYVSANMAIRNGDTENGLPQRVYRLLESYAPSVYFNEYEVTLDVEPEPFAEGLLYLNDNDGEPFYDISSDSSFLTSDYNESDLKKISGVVTITEAEDESADASIRDFRTGEELLSWHSDSVASVKSSVSGKWKKYCRDRYYNALMESVMPGIEAGISEGSKLIDFNTEEEKYGTSFVPSEFVPVPGDVVAGIIRYTYSYTRTGGWYQDYYGQIEYIGGDIEHLAVKILLPDGTEVAARSFSAGQPTTIWGNDCSSYVDSYEVDEWIETTWKHWLDKNGIAY